MKQCKSCGGDCGKVCEYKGGESDMLTIAYMQGYSDGKKDSNPEGMRLVSDELVSMFCTAIDNLADMPISNDWAADFAERGHKLLADNNYFRNKAILQSAPKKG